MLLADFLNTFYSNLILLHFSLFLFCFILFYFVLFYFTFTFIWFDNWFDSSYIFIWLEYEIHQDVICLFSETLQRSLKNQLVTQDMVDQFDPSLMFAIPRLAIVCGLLIFPNGPLNVDREYSDFPELFRPFKNLLRKVSCKIGFCWEKRQKKKLATNFKYL